MLKQVRKKIASSISNSDEPEQFLWNKWLRAPITEYEVVTSPMVQMYDTEDLNEWIPPPGLQQEKFDFTRSRVSKKIEKYFTSKSKTHKIFFGFGEGSIHSVEFSENNPLKFFYTARLEQKDADIFMNVKKGDSKESTVKLNPQQKESSFKFKASKSENIDLPRSKLDPQKTKNLINKQGLSSAKLNTAEKEDLVNLKPEIINIGLLNLDELSKSPGGKNIKDPFAPIKSKTEVSKVEVQSPDKLIQSTDYSEKEMNKAVAFNKVKSSPKIYKVKTSGIEKINAPVYFLKDIHPQRVNVVNSNTEISKYFGVKEEIKVIDPFTLISKESGQTLLNSILQPQIGIKEEEKQELLFKLYNYQKEGAQFLSERQRSIIAEETGTGKTLEAVAAVRILFKQKSIKSALVICPQFEVGNIDVTNATRNPAGWAGHFYAYAPELSINIIKGDEKNEKLEKQTLKEKWSTQSSVFILGYSSLVKSINYEIIDKERFKKFDCIIFDEVQNMISKNVTSYFSGLEGKTKFMFGLSSLQAALFKSNIEPVFNNDKTKVEILQRKKSEFVKEIPSVIKQEYWLELDANQKIEYGNIFSQGKEKLSQLIQGGNPFLIQSNVFTLLHQLKQACNFFSSSEASPKSDLLLSQLEIISKNKKKALVFSQYDKMGTQKLEQVLKKAGISSMVYQTGMSVKEMEKITRNFRISKDATALIFGLKAGGQNINLPDAHHVIHFDNWWNPITLWQIEEKISSLEKGDPLEISSYLTADSIDLKINEMLTKKGLFEKNIIETLNPENIYEFFNSTDWSHIFQLPGSSGKEIEDKLIKAEANVDELTIDDFQNKLKMFFTRLGYKNLVLKAEKKNSEIDVTGSFMKSGKDTKMRAKCIFSKKKDEENIESFFNSKDGKLFYITLADTAKKPELKLPQNGSYISRQMFVNYLVHFKLI